MNDIDTEIILNFIESNSDFNTISDKKEFARKISLFLNRQDDFLIDELSIIQSLLPDLLDFITNRGIKSIQNEPIDDETKPAPSGYDESLFLLDKLPRPRTKRFRQDDVSLLKYYNFNNQFDEQLLKKTQLKDIEQFNKNKELGDQFYERNNFEDAIKCYSNAITFNSTSHFAFFARSCAFNQLDLFESAISDLKRTIELDPNFTIAYFQLAEIYEKKGDLIEALEVYEKFPNIDDISKEAISRILDKISLILNGQQNFLIIPNSTYERDFFVKIKDLAPKDHQLLLKSLKLKPIKVFMKILVQQSQKKN